jgi:anti-sigma regulatory factor (Ser/Thr protein kinase)
VEDEGPGFDPSTVPDPTDPEHLTRIGGRGLLLIRAFMDHVEHSGKGNRITMRKNYLTRDCSATPDVVQTEF